MDSQRFDAWTRRRFGLGLSGLAVTLLGLATPGEVEAKKRGRKKKRKKASPPPPPPGCDNCDDGVACTTDACDASGTCIHTPDESACASSNPCLEGRCAPTDPARDANGCVFDPVDGGTITCGIGACQRTVQRCVDGQEQQCVPGAPSPEVCDGIDNDCDGAVDEDFPQLGQPCDGSDADSDQEGIWVCDANGGVVCTDTTG